LPLWFHMYVGRMVEIIYWDADQRLTQRTIERVSIHPTFVSAYCLERQALHFPSRTHMSSASNLEREV
jgi:hypothetical protein